MHSDVVDATPQRFAERAVEQFENDEAFARQLQVRRGIHSRTLFFMITQQPTLVELRMMRKDKVWQLQEEIDLEVAFAVHETKSPEPRGFVPASSLSQPVTPPSTRSK